MAVEPSHITTLKRSLKDLIAATQKGAAKTKEEQEAARKALLTGKPQVKKA